MSSFSRLRIDKLNQTRLMNVDARLVEAANKIIQAARDADLDLLVTCGYRSNLEQTKLYAQGRTRPGKIVTNARAGQSKHNHLPSKAVDFVFVVNGEITWDISYFKRLGVWAKMFSVSWGGNWKSFKDYPHIEL